jgi:putative nucleotidyltransferase with HDIG domain
VAEAAAAQAAVNRHEQPLVEELPEAEIEVPAEQAAPADPPTRIHIGAVVLMLAGTGVIAALSSLDQIGAKPGIFAALVAAVLILDIVRLDVFDRGNVSPAGVPAIALAILFGPLGPILAEAVIAVSRAIRRTPARIWLADFGMLSLTGAATAWTWMALDPATHLAMLGGGAAAGLTSYVVNAALLIPLIALTRRVAMLDTFKEGFAWLWPHYLAFGLLAGGLVLAEESIGGYAFVLFAMPLVMLWLGEQQYINRSRSSVDELRAKHDELQSANASLRSLLDEKQALLSRMHRSYLSTITSLARTIEAKDPYTGGHTERVARIACLLAEEMAFGAEDVRAVNVGAVIHDIGKIGVPDRVLLKAGPLEPEEIDEIRRHPEISSYILADLDLPPIVKQMVRSHHERFGGGGYPDGLVGEEIPMAARILSVADALDAMTSDRPYRDAMPIEDALAEIDARIGEQFCPRVVVALHSCLDRQPELVSELFGVAALG